jgi:type I restriction enzyme S subunit
MNNILLKDYLIEITKGTTPTTIGGEFIESGVNFVKAECLNTGRIIDKSSLSYISPEIHKKLNRSILQEDDLLFSIAGHLGKMAIVRKEDLPANTNQAVAILRIDQKKGDVNFLYYYLNSTQISNYIRKQCAQSVQPNLNLAQVGQLPIIVYSLPTQRSIAKVLSDLDAKIELNNKINRELEAMAKTLYDYWFVQFDFPTPPSSTSGIVGKPYKSSGGKMVYNEELKREIPEGWEVGTLLDIATFTNGLACQKYRPINKEFLPVIKIREMREGFTKDTEKVRPDISENLIVNNGDVLFSWSASLEVIIWTGGKGGLNQHIFKVMSKKYPRSFYYFQLIWYLQHFKMIAELRKTTMGHITQEHLKQSRIVVPPLDLIKQLDKQLNPIQEKQVLLHKQNQQLSSLRDWLLPMLMNGQVASRASATGESRASATEE